MRLVLACALLAVTAGCVSAGKYRTLDAEAKVLRRRGTELEAALARKSADLDAAQGRTVELEARAKELEGRVAELSAAEHRLQTAKAELEKKSVEYERMQSALRSEIDAGRVELTELRGKVTVKMKDKILFSSGSATLGKDGRDALAAVAGVLKEAGGKVIRVEGHTDNVPLGRGAYTNWELSSARALAVVRFLQDAGVDPARLAAAGYGEYQPIAANDTPEGRSQNRRIEIVLAPADAAPPAAVAAETR